MKQENEIQQSEKEIAEMKSWLQVAIDWDRFMKSWKYYMTKHNEAEISLKGLTEDYWKVLFNYVED